MTTALTLLAVSAGIVFLLLAWVLSAPYSTEDEDAERPDDQ